MATLFPKLDPNGKCGQELFTSDKAALFATFRSFDTFIDPYHLSRADFEPSPFQPLFPLIPEEKHDSFHFFTDEAASLYFLNHPLVYRLLPILSHELSPSCLPMPTYNALPTSSLQDLMIVRLVKTFSSIRDEATRNIIGWITPEEFDSSLFTSPVEFPRGFPFPDSREFSGTHPMLKYVHPPDHFTIFRGVAPNEHMLELVCILMGTSLDGIEVLHVLDTLHDTLPQLTQIYRQFRAVIEPACFHEFYNSLRALIDELPEDKRQGPWTKSPPFPDALLEYWDDRHPGENSIALPLVEHQSPAYSPSFVPSTPQSPEPLVPALASPPRDLSLKPPPVSFLSGSDILKNLSGNGLRSIPQEALSLLQQNTNLQLSGPRRSTRHKAVEPSAPAKVAKKGRKRKATEPPPSISPPPQIATLNDGESGAPVAEEEERTKKQSRKSKSVRGEEPTVDTTGKQLFPLVHKSSKKTRGSSTTAVPYIPPFDVPHFNSALLAQEGEKTREGTINDLGCTNCITRWHDCSCQPIGVRYEKCTANGDSMCSHAFSQEEHLDQTNRLVEAVALDHAAYNLSRQAAQFNAIRLKVASHALAKHLHLQRRSFGPSVLPQLDNIPSEMHEIWPAFIDGAISNLDDPYIYSAKPTDDLLWSFLHPNAEKTQSTLDGIFARYC
ncbi:hypothetical protein B0H19DRAFT_1267387 [Mycena capillaripes]|nr:hypothetical protein B0H19DRAFT_1267387 [Mycena capillaripes]